MTDGDPVYTRDLRMKMSGIDQKTTGLFKREGDNYKTWDGQWELNGSDPRVREGEPDCSFSSNTGGFGTDCDRVSLMKATPDRVNSIFRMFYLMNQLSDEMEELFSEKQIQSTLQSLQEGDFILPGSTTSQERMKSS